MSTAAAVFLGLCALGLGRLPLELHGWRVHDDHNIARRVQPHLVRAGRLAHGPR